MGPKNPIPVAGIVLGVRRCLQKQRRAGRQPADGAPRSTAPTAFAKEYWILKDWKSLSGVLGAGAPI